MEMLSSFKLKLNDNKTELMRVTSYSYIFTSYSFDDLHRISMYFVN